MDDYTRSYLAIQAQFGNGGVARRAENFVARRIEGPQPYSLVRVENGAERAWRVTLGRLVCSGHRAPTVAGASPQGYPLVPPAQYPYAAGLYNAAEFYPGRRSYPIFGMSPLGFGRVWVELAWGIDLMSANRMVADWPMMGGSIILPGSYVEVSSIVTMTGVDQMTDDDMPTGSAMVMDAAGVTSQDSNEMSLVQEVDLIDDYGALVSIPDFARRVQVSITQSLILPNLGGGGFGEEFEVPVTGDRPCRLVWLDDRGDTAFAGYQRTSEPAVGGIPANAPVAWQPVPSRATMLALRTSNPQSAIPSTALIHWRLAP